MFLYILITLRKYCFYFIFNVFIMFTNFNFNLCYIVTLKLIINFIIIIYIYLTQITLHFYVNAVSLIKAVRYNYNLFIKILNYFYIYKYYKGFVR